MSLLSKIIAASRKREGGGAPPSPSYGNTGGTGNRTGIITVTSSMTSSGAALSALVDGTTTDNTGPWFNSIDDGATVEFDFGSPQIITEATFRYNTSVNFGNWSWQGWTGSSWVDIGGIFALGAAGGASPQVLSTLASNVNGYSKYRIIKASGTGSNWYWNEMEFKIAAGSGAGTTSWLVNQGFEGTDFDGGEAWTTSGSVVDPNYTTSPIVGSQSLHIAASAAAASARIDFAGQSQLFVKMRMRVNSFSGNPIIGRILTGSSSVANLQIAVNKLRVNPQNGSNYDTTDNLPTATDLWVWLEFVKGSGSNGVFRAGWNTVDSKPDLSGGGSTVCAGSNGTTTTDATRLQLGHTGSGTFDLVFDAVQVAATAF